MMLQGASTSLYDVRASRMRLWSWQQGHVPVEHASAAADVVAVAIFSSKAYARDTDTASAQPFEAAAN